MHTHHQLKIRSIQKATPVLDTEFDEKQEDDISSHIASYAGLSDPHSFMLRNFLRGAAGDAQRCCPEDDPEPASPPIFFGEDFVPEPAGSARHRDQKKPFDQWADDGGKASPVVVDDACHSRARPEEPTGSKQH